MERLRLPEDRAVVVLRMAAQELQAPVERPFLRSPARFLPPGHLDGAVSEQVPGRPGAPLAGFVQQAVGSPFDEPSATNATTREEMPHHALLSRRFEAGGEELFDLVVAQMHPGSLVALSIRNFHYCMAEMRAWRRCGRIPIRGRCSASGGGRTLRSGAVFAWRGGRTGGEALSRPREADAPPRRACVRLPRRTRRAGEAVRPPFQATHPVLEAKRPLFTAARGVARAFFG